MGPWQWVPDLGPWAARLAEAASAWHPAPGLGLETAAIRSAITEGARVAAPWLRHPCMSRLTRPQPAHPYRDQLMAAWVAAKVDGDLGRVEFRDPIVIWSAAGDEEIGPGSYQLSELGRLVARPAPVPLALDVWCRATGVVSAGSWADLHCEDYAGREEELGAGIQRFLRLMAALVQLLPDLMAWMTSATSVVRPLVPRPDVARSSHDLGLPGLIEADLCKGRTQTVELLVHETAHLHLRAAEADGGLVDPDHDGRYRSPLRPEPRPLIGILLAYHALAYICAALVDGVGAGVLDAGTVGQAVADLGRRRDDARAVVEEARNHLTPTGAAFVERTHGVADHVA